MSEAKLIPEKAKELARTDEATTPAQLLSIAVSQGADLEKMEKLMELQERWEKNEARKAYYAAVAKFKEDPPTVVKDMLNKQYGSKYSSLANFVNTINGPLSQVGLHAHWVFEQGETIKATCILSHILGHSESVSLSGPPDTSGSKNALQQIKSTITYLKIATLEGVTGIASVEGNLDDDGNTAIETITEKQVADLECMIDEVGADKDAFLKYLKISSLEELRASSYQAAINALEAKRKKANA